MNKTFLILVGFFFSFFVFFAFVNTAYAVNDCLTGAIISNGGNGRPASIKITNGIACAAKQVSFCSYRVYIERPGVGWLKTQTLFDSETKTVGTGKTVTFTINTDTCLNQIDAFEGKCHVYTSDATGTPGIIYGKMGTGKVCTKCTDECVSGQPECSGNGWRQCGDYDNDSCTEWGTITNCNINETCGNGTCVDICTATLSGSPSNTEQQQCAAKNGRMQCGNGWCKCNCAQIPIVEITSSGAAGCNQNATLIWVSENADSCSASDGWSGNKSLSGTEAVGNFTGTKKFTITCTGNGGTAVDFVNVTGGAVDDLHANAGSDKDIDENDSVKLNGSVDGDYDSITWKCTDGTLSNYHTLQPTYHAPENDYNYDKTHTCTLTAKNECGSDSDSVKITVGYEKTSNFKIALVARPKSDCAPFNNVDLVATLSNYGNNDYDYTYYFDCENDGDWDKTVTTEDTDYTAVGLCDYANVGSYTAKVKVTSHNRTASDTDIVRANECGTTRQYGNSSITKMVKNVSRNTNYQGSVLANPAEIVSYKIIVTGISGTSNNVMLSDVVPAGIVNIRDLEIDGYPETDNIQSGINLGTITSGQTKIVTYTATVADQASFTYGQTNLNNVATVTVDGSSASSNATVMVYRQAILGATTISTGFDSDVMAGLGIALLAAMGCLLWVTRENVAGLFKKKI